MREKHQPQGLCGSGTQYEETTMRKIIVAVVAAALTSASTAQRAAASQHHRVRADERTTTNQPFRNAHNSLAAPVQRGWYYSGYSAPAGH
jgi:hypothetical protein